MKLLVKKRNESYVSLVSEPIVLKSIFDYFKFRPQNYQFTPSYKTKKWDGWIRLYDINKNLFPLGLLFKLVPFCKAQNIEITFENFNDEPINLTEDFIIDYANNTLKIDSSRALRDYQITGIQTGIREKHCILLSPTGTGKSLIIYCLLRLILKYNPSFKVLIVVPTLSLIDQMAGDFIEYSEHTGLDFDKFIQRKFTDKSKNVDKQIVITTYQSIQYEEPNFFKQFGAILVDECHVSSLKENKVSQMIYNCTNAKYKIGFSGTLQDATFNLYSLYSSFGKVYPLTQTKKEIDRGNLSDVLIWQILIYYPNEISKQFFEEKKKWEKENIFFDNKQTLMYQKEIDYINTLPFKSNLINSICNKQKMNTLVLFRLNEFGNNLYNLLKNNLPDRQVFIVTGQTEKDFREDIRKICEVNNNVVIVANYKIFSTGINIKNLHNIIFAESIKSKITTLQSIGRGLRLHSSKDKAQIFDLVDVLTYNGELNITAKHSSYRSEIYEKENFKVIKKDYVCSTAG